MQCASYCRNRGIKYINNNKQMTEKQTNEDRSGMEKKQKMKMYGWNLREPATTKNSEYSFFCCCQNNNKEIIIHHCLVQLFFSLLMKNKIRMPIWKMKALIIFIFVITLIMICIYLGFDNLWQKLE